jgi:hypothetical protein
MTSGDSTGRPVANQLDEHSLVKRIAIIGLFSYRELLVCFSPTSRGLISVLPGLLRESVLNRYPGDLFLHAS